MSRNGSGTMSVVNTLVSGTPITAAAHNQNYSDIASEITNSVAVDGQSTMTGPLKASSGTALAPSYTFGSDTDTGAYRSASNEYSVAAGGAQITKIHTGGVDIVTGDLNVVGGEVQLAGVPAFPVPTAQLQDKSVTLRKLFHPSGPSKLLGSNSNAALTITATANNGAGLIRLSVASTATFTTGQSKTVSDVVGTTEANGTWTIAVVDATHIDLQGSTYTNAYVSGGTIGGAVDEISIGSGLTLSGSTLKAAFPPQGAFKNLSIKVATTTTVAVAADFVTTTDGTGYLTTTLSGTIDFGVTGANGLDSGGIAAATWYAIWAIAKTDGTTAALASTSGTAPTLPTGYTFKARIGWVRTITSGATLYGTWQLGRRAQYILSLGSTGTTYPAIATMGAGYWTAASVSGVVPSTASQIFGQMSVAIAAGTAATYGVNPNSAPASTNGAFFRTEFNSSTSFLTSYAFSMLLESSNIYHGQGNTNSGVVHCSGWEDNI